MALQPSFPSGRHRAVVVPPWHGVGAVGRLRLVALLSGFAAVSVVRLRLLVLPACSLVLRVVGGLFCPSNAHARARLCRNTSNASSSGIA